MRAGGPNHVRPRTGDVIRTLERNTTAPGDDDLGTLLFDDDGSGDLLRGRPSQPHDLRVGKAASPQLDAAGVAALDTRIVVVRKQRCPGRLGKRRERPAT